MLAGANNSDPSSLEVPARSLRWTFDREAAMGSLFSSSLLEDVHMKSYASRPRYCPEYQVKLREIIKCRDTKEFD
jgi:hypothetical protein